MDRPSPLVGLTAGTLAGLASCLVLQPLDVIKTRLQLPAPPHSGPHPWGQGASFLRPCYTRNMINTIYNTHGVQGFWKGSFATIVRNVPGVTFYFVGYESLTRTACAANPDLPYQAAAVYASVVSRTIVGAAMMPFSMVKTRIESSVYEYRSVFAAVREITHLEGPRVLFAGCLPTLARDVPFTALFMALYQHFKLNPGSNYVNDPGTHYAMAALASAYTASFLTHPFDVIKTRIQLFPAENASIMAAVRGTLRGPGILGFWNGMMPRTIRKSIQAAITWATYEKVSQYFSSSQETIS